MARISYQNLIKERRAWYKTIEKVYCPCLRENIVFNSKGFYHLKYDGLNKARSKKERMYRIGLLPLTVPVIKSAKKVYKYTPRIYSKKINKYVEYWALREIVGKRKALVTVILRRIGNGQITFYSVMKRSSGKKSNSPRRTSGGKIGKTSKKPLK